MKLPRSKRRLKVLARKLEKQTRSFNYARRRLEAQRRRIQVPVDKLL